MTKNFVAVFDRGYAMRGITLARSICQHNPDAEMYVVAYDDETYEIIKDCPHIHPIHLWEIEDKGTLAVKGDRTPPEYMWTMKSTIMLRLLDQGLSNITYLDGDMFCFGPLDSLYHEIGVRPLAATPHRGPKDNPQALRDNGYYNAGYLYMRNNYRRMDFLREWREECLNWCYNCHGANGQKGDQVYLDALVPKYDGLDIRHLGVNLAPWSQGQYQYSMIGDCPHVENHPILLYHFHEFKHDENGNMTRRTGYDLHPFVVEHVYRPYEKALKDTVCGY